MEISFSNQRIRKVCESHREMAKLGPMMAKVLKRRMADLIAAVCLEDLKSVSGAYHELSGDRKGQFSTSLKQPFRLIFEPDHDPVPRKDDGGINWSMVTRVQIIEIVDYH